MLVGRIEPTIPYLSYVPQLKPSYLVQKKLKPSYHTLAQS
jgi:hypothetical protein